MRAFSLATTSSRELRSSGSLYSVKTQKSAALGYRLTCCGVNLFFKELSTCATDDDVMLTDNAVRTQRSLLPPHRTDTTSKSSRKALLENGQIPEFSNPAKVFFVMNENGSAGAVMYQFPPPNIGHHPVILCNSVFCLKRPLNRNIKRLQLPKVIIL